MSHNLCDRIRVQQLNCSTAPSTDTYNHLKMPLKRAQQRQIVDHASKEIFVNHFKIISSQDQNIRDEAVEKG